MTAGNGGNGTTPSLTPEIDAFQLGKRLTYLCIGLFAIGVLGEVVGHAVQHPMPAWESTLFTDMLAIGVFGGFVSFFFVMIFGTLLQNLN